ncbi:HigA family addiction module antitoxin [Serratia fonticola]|uniref:HigA family addiction module antitoxin n=1 Tax=Serratia fonticola TaxID=47917 RepID=UPI002178A29B|nr:HigA family addiction module antitoxin [Serratia fonticola]CAI1728176.1 Plasmid maintenance system antidote protein [Serratia fonticola]
MPMYDPPHPGEAVRLDVLPEIGLSIAALAEHLGYSHSHLSAVLNGRAAISADLAHRLELAGLGRARQYLAEQVAYDLWQVKQHVHPPIGRLSIR